MRIIIADDHTLFAEGLKNLLKSEDFEIIAVVDNGEKAVKKTIAEKPDLVLMDIEMPVINGIEATRKIKKELPEIRIIILTSFEEEDSLLKAVKAGASGYLIKSIDGEELIKSLYEIKEGKNPFSAGLEDCLLSQIKDNKQQSQDSSDSRSIKEKLDSPALKELTSRQLEVVKLLVEGLTYREIGEKLYVSERTIKYHMEQIKNQLGLKTQAQVIAYARDNIK